MFSVPLHNFAKTRSGKLCYTVGWNLILTGRRATEKMVELMGKWVDELKRSTHRRIFIKTVTLVKEAWHTTNEEVIYTEVGRGRDFSRLCLQRAHPFKLERCLPALSVMLSFM